MKSGAHSREIPRSLLLLLLFTGLGFAPVLAQEKLTISPEGQQLKQIYLSMNVETLWIAEHHINWETGLPDMPEATHGIKTHCSAFIAAACKKLNIYILRPPEHGQVLLANAQADWLDSDAGLKAGWHRLPANDQLYHDAQSLANAGKVVVAVCKNPDKSKPGHAALVMPSARSEQQLTEDGPEIIMAGTHNHNYIALKNGFRSHITTWPEPGIWFFVYSPPGP